MAEAGRLTLGLKAVLGVGRDAQRRFADARSPAVLPRGSDTPARHPVPDTDLTAAGETSQADCSVGSDDRYSVRRGSVPLTRAQWIFVLAAALIGLAGLLLVLVGHPIGAALMALAGIAIAGTAYAARSSAGA